MSFDPKRTPTWMAIYNSLSPYTHSQGQAEEMTDAVVAALQGDPVKKVTTIQGGEVYWIDGDDDARSAFGNGIIVQRGYFVPVTE